MKIKLLSLIIAGGFALSSAGQADAATALFEGHVNIDGGLTDIINGPLPPGVNLGGFDTLTGLGFITLTVTGSGSHFAGLYLDLEIEEPSNTFFNEVGSTSGTRDGRQSWEIDEPGFAGPPDGPGDIFDNFSGSDATLGSLLDNSVFDAVASPNDVAAALGWDFTLAAGETATVSFTSSQTAPTGGFYLVHTDPDSNESVYYSSTLRITGGGTPTPEGGQSLTLLGLAVIAMGLFLRRKAS